MSNYQNFIALHTMKLKSRIQFTIKSFLYKALKIIWLLNAKKFKFFICCTLQKKIEKKFLFQKDSKKNELSEYLVNCLTIVWIAFYFLTEGAMFAWFFFFFFDISDTVPTRREKYSNVLQTDIVIVGQVRNMSFSPKLWYSVT